MRTTRPLGQSVLALLAGLSLGACVATTLPIVGSAGPSTAPSVSPSSALSSSARPAASLVEVASAPPSVAPPATNSPDPTEDPGTAGPGCGTGHAGFMAHRDEIPPRLQFGGATIEFTTAIASLRNGTYDAGDSIPGGIGLTANEIAVVVGPGDHVILRGGGLTILDTQAAAVPWSMVTVDGGLADLAGPRTPLASRARDDGSLSISAPDQIGDWAVEFVPRWQSDCLEGDGTAYSRIKVR